MKFDVTGKVDASISKSFMLLASRIEKLIPDILESGSEFRSIILSYSPVILRSEFLELLDEESDHKIQNGVLYYYPKIDFQSFRGSDDDGRFMILLNSLSGCSKYMGKYFGGDRVAQEFEERLSNWREYVG